jgi:hypothetical protein
MNLFSTQFPNNFSQKLALLKVVGLGLRNPVSTPETVLFLLLAGVPGNKKIF